MATLSVSEDVQVGALTAAVVYGIFQLNAPNLADVKAAPSGNPVAHSSVKTAAWTATIVTAGLSLLAKSPTIFVIGGVMTIIETWKYHHANVVDGATGKIDPLAFG